MAASGKKLGKLSLAILENFVEGTLGKKFVEELRTPTEQTLAIETALEHTEAIFRKNFDGQDLAHAIFVDLPVDPAKLSTVIANFFEHPTDPDFPQNLENLLTSEFKNLSHERVQSAVLFYIKTLKQELALADPGFREKIKLLADLETLEYIKEIEKHQKKPSQKEPAAITYENVQLILDGNFQEFSDVKQNEIVVVLSALLHTEQRNIKVLRVMPGSIIIEIELEDFLASRLVSLVEDGNLRLSELGVIGLRLNTGKYISAGAPLQIPLGPSGKISSTQTTNKLKVFLCHASEDKPIVKSLYDDLIAAGYEPWLDSEVLLPGVDWDLEIKKAMRTSDIVIICFSSVLVGKEGYLQKELRFAQDAHDEKLRGAIFLIPLRLDGSEIPFNFRVMHWGDYTAPDGFEKLTRSLNMRAKQLGKKEGSAKKKTTLISKDKLPPVGDLPIGSRIPFSPNPNFEGRVGELKKLAESLLGASNTGVVINQAITGMGGLGKTQLAVEFAYRYGRSYRGVHWLDLADPSLLDSEIAQCGTQMSLADFPTDQPSQVALTINTWKADGPRLLVLDNFEAVEQVNNVLTRLRHSNLHLLVTSRRTDWTHASGLHLLSLELFTPQESLDFLRKSLNSRKDTNSDLTTLAERLGHLPLALELASRYLNGHARLTITRYLYQVQKAYDHPSMRNWRKDLPIPTEHDLDMQSTFALSYVAIDRIAQTIFVLAGCLAPRIPIIPEILEKILQISPEVCDEDLSRLYGLSLLRQTENNSSTAIHPLLAEFAQGLEKGDNSFKIFLQVYYLEYYKHLRDSYETLRKSKKKIPPRLVADQYYIIQKILPSHSVFQRIPAPATDREKKLYDELMQKIESFVAIEQLIDIESEVDPKASREELLEKINRNWDQDMK